MPLKYLVAVAVALCGLSRISACSCLPPGPLCEMVRSSDIIIHVKAVTRVEGENINDDVIYTLETIQVFKAEEPGPNEYDDAGATFDMTTGGNSALCGVFMLTDGTEYLIDIVRQSDGSLRANGICGLFRQWNEEDREQLEEGCDDYDPCGGECGDFQVCMANFDFSAYEYSYYCEDTCDPSPCADGEECALDYPTCSDASLCSTVAICSGDTEGPTSSPSAPTSAPSVMAVLTTSPDGGLTPSFVTPAPTARDNDGTSSPTASADGSRDIFLTASPSAASTADAVDSIPAGTSSPTSAINAGGGSDDASGAASAVLNPKGGGVAAARGAGAVAAVTAAALFFAL